MACGAWFTCESSPDRESCVCHAWTTPRNSNLRFTTKQTTGSGRLAASILGSGQERGLVRSIRRDGTNALNFNGWLSQAALATSLLAKTTKEYTRYAARFHSRQDSVA